MALKMARLINLILAGMLTGNEFASLVAVYPALATLPPLAGLQAEQAVYRRFGTVMPVYMQATIGSFLPVLALQRDRRSPAFRYTVAGAACFAAMLAITATQNLPLNNRIVALPEEEASVAEFWTLKHQWDRLHAARNLLNVLGLAFTCVAALSADEASAVGQAAR